jgi:mycothiol synthase
MALPDGYIARAATLDDLDAVLRIRTQKEIEDWGAAHTTAEELRDLWESTNLAEDTWVVLDTIDNIVATAQIYGAGSPVPLIDVAVLLDYQRRGIGTHLLTLAEKRAEAATTDVPEGKSRALAAQVSGRNHNAKEVLEKAGYQVTSIFHVMEAALDFEPSKPLIGEGIEIRNFVVGKDEQLVYEADEEAFQDEFGKTPRTFAQWARRLNMRDGFDAGLWFVAWDGDQVAGSSLCEMEEGKGRIHHLGVRRAWRRKGLGMALLLHTMHTFYVRGVKLLILNVDAKSLTNANRLYERAGFSVVNEYHNYKKAL